MRLLPAIARPAIAVVAAAIALGGCAHTTSNRPPTQTRPTAQSRPPTHARHTTQTGPTATTPTKLARAEEAHEYPSPPPPAQTAASTAADPATAVRAFATAYINWDSATVAASLNRLARVSVGQARSAMTLAAAQVAGDYELRRGGVANHGTIEAIAPLAGRPDQYAVVTREVTTATATTAYDGLAPAWHVALATVARQPGGGYAVSGWQPES